MSNYATKARLVEADSPLKAAHPQTTSEPLPAGIPGEVRAVVFDAVGTLIRPQPSVAEIYAELARRHGATLSPADVRERFPAVYQRHFGARSTVGLAGQNTNDVEPSAEPWQTCESLERARWHGVIADLFGQEVQPIEPLFESLWEHFGRAGGWAVFDDVEPTFAALAKRGYTLAIASNFDERLDGLCRELPALTACRFVFPSSRIGWAKPSVHFFRAVERLLGCEPNQLLLVGDDPRNDVEGALAAGWHARWLVRDGQASATIPAVTAVARLTQLLGDFGGS